MLSQFLFKTFIWQAFIFLGLSGGGFPTAPVSVLNNQSVREQMAEKAEAEQIGGDSSIISAAPVKTLPLALSRSERAPQRKPEMVDFDIRKATFKSAIVIDEDTENTLFAFNENEVRSIGSLTKLMTALVFLDTAPQWNKVVTIESTDGSQGRLNVVEGEQVTVKDLFHVSLVSSSNNATMALTRSTGLHIEEFVKRMNVKATDLGLKQTIFTEPTGLDPANQSTAKEIAWLLKFALSEKNIKEIVVKNNYTFNLMPNGPTRNISSTNVLLSERLPVGAVKIVGGKTGFVEEAGYCFAVALENKDGHQIITVVLGSSTHYGRFSETRSLTEWVFGAYAWPPQVESF
jgi:D-alanyl-D-alanine endopeptidase (penicillin-binding protein 7)